MAKVLKSSKISIKCPDGFHVMTTEELKKNHMYTGIAQWCVTDPVRQLILSVTWKEKHSGLRGLVDNSLGTKEISREMQRKMAKGMRGFQYKLDGFTVWKLDGKRADGFLYHYTLQGLPMFGEYLAVKKDNLVYYLNYYAKADNEVESREIFKDMLASLKWV